MDIELLEIRDFLQLYHPFDQLPEQALNELPEKLQVRYFRRETAIPDGDDLVSFLYLVRTGAVEIRNAEQELFARLGEGDVFGYRTSSRDDPQAYNAVAIEDSLLYLLPAREVDDLCERYAQFAYFFVPVGGDRLREAITHSADDASSQLSLMTTQLGEMITRSPVVISPAATIRETAEKMSVERVSSILVTEGGKLIGIVTDRDLRRRVVSKGLDTGLPITEIMTASPLTMEETDYAFEALLNMARSNIHHLPIVRGGQLKGMLTATDLSQRHTTSAVYLVSAIYKQTEIERLREITAKTPQVLVNMAAADATADSIGHVITAITDSVTTRLLQLAEERLGPPPIPFAWVAAGSQARSEQTAKSDQDNCMILDDAFDPEVHGAYFEALSKFVCDGLNACGYVYCPGEMMATTEKWRQPLRRWKEYFRSWIDEPEPMALMLTSVFFDLRCIYGDLNLFDELRRYMLNKTRGNRFFLAFMAGNALSHQPPLGFFRNFVLIRGGEHDHTFDVKHNGIVPIVDLARVYALAAGNDAVNTLERLKMVAVGGEVTAEGARDLYDALEFISSLRIEHQARQIREGVPPDNFLSPDNLSQFERNHLKDAFSVVRTMQNVLSQRYQK